MKLTNSGRKTPLPLDKKKIGKRIREIRKNQCNTLDQFCIRLDDSVIRGTISNWENGTYLPTLKRLEKIANIGNVSVNYLLFGSEQDVLNSILEQFEKHDITISKNTKLSFSVADLYYTVKDLNYLIQEIISKIIELQPTVTQEKNYFAFYTDLSLSFSLENSEYALQIIPLINQFIQSDPLAIEKLKTFLLHEVASKEDIE